MESFKDLKVWQKSMLLVKEIYSIAKKLPKEETFALSDQMRRSAISIPSNIAEGFGRNSANEYARFLNIAKGSSYELETQLYICDMLNYSSNKEIKHAIELTEEIEKMISALVKSLSNNS